MSDPNADPVLTVQLPLSLWRILLAHLQAGQFSDVGNSFSETIYGQLQRQMAEACAVQERKVIEEARTVAAEAAKAPAAEPIPSLDAKAMH